MCFLLLPYFFFFCQILLAQAVDPKTTPLINLADFSTLRSIYRTDLLETFEQKVMFMSTDDTQDSLSIKKQQGGSHSYVCLRSRQHLYIKEWLKSYTML